MKEILIITGACGVGKSSISRKWATLKKGAVIEADYFTEWIYNDIYKRFLAEEEKLVADLSVVTAIEYLNHNMPVAIENVWTPAGLERLKIGFEREFENVKIKFIWLICDLEENHTRDKTRNPENQMKERVDIVNAELKSYEWPSYLNIIDSTNLTANDTLKLIVDLP